MRQMLFCTVTYMVTTVKTTFSCMVATPEAIIPRSFKREYFL